MSNRKTRWLAKVFGVMALVGGCTTRNVIPELLPTDSHTRHQLPETEVSHAHDIPYELCVQPEVECSGVCVNLQTHAEHCGGCNQRCAGRQTCHNGACICEPGLSWCDRAGCVDHLSDLQHCGGCGLACQVGLLCIEGQCACPKGLSWCGSECVDLNANPQHCGGCDRSCGGSTSCENGECSTPTPTE